MPDGTHIYAQGVHVALDASLAFPSGPTVPSGQFLLESIVQFGGNPPPYRVVASLDPATTVQVVSASLTAAEEQLQRELEVMRLLLAIEDGSLDGRMVLITGALKMVAWPCPSGVPEPCTRFYIPGLDGVAVTWDGPLGVWNDARASGAPSPAPVAGTLVVTPRNGSLRLLGRLIGNLEQPASIQELTDGRLLSARMDPFALAAVAGWLVVGGTQSCRAPAPDATQCPGPGPLLTDVEPSPDGRMTNYDRQQSVRVWPGAVGIDPAQVVTPGPFLFRTVVNPPCAGPDCTDTSRAWSWEIMGRYDTGSVYRVAVP